MVRNEFERIIDQLADRQHFGVPQFRELTPSRCIRLACLI